MKKIAILTAIAFLAGASPLQAKTLDEIFNEAANFLEEGEYEQAVKKYREAIVMEPKSALAYNLLGMAYRFWFALTRRKEYKNEEIAAFRKAIELDQNYWVSYINLGATYYYLGDTKEAAPHFKKALELYPDHPERPMFEKVIREAEAHDAAPVRPEKKEAEKPKKKAA